MRLLVVIFLIISFSIQSFSQSDAKIEKQLNRLFQKGKFEKCYRKALKLNRKSPDSYVPEYYISMISLTYYTSITNSSTEYINLQKAVRFSLKLPDSYSNWKNEVRDSLDSYITNLHETGDKPEKCKNALQFYINSYSDTLSLYAYYFSGFHIEKPNHEKVYHESREDSLRWILIKVAEEQNGVQYRYGGESPETGFDCSGFTKYVYGKIGIELPHNAQKQSNLDGIEKTLQEARPGDLVFFGSRYKNSHRAGHAGIIHSNQNGKIKVIHCVSGGVSIDGSNSSWEHYWKDKVIFVKTIKQLMSL